MSKKQSKKPTSKKPLAKAHAKATSRPGAVNKPATAKGARATPVTAATAATAATVAAVGRRPADSSESRLPPPGTVIQKLDRYGAVRCECAVEEAGIRYNGNLYRSLSGAAMAAAKDLGLTNKTQNGFTFWGITKPRRPGDPFESLAHAWDRYQKHLTTVVKEGLTDESQAEVATMVDEHTRALQALRGQISVNQAPAAP